MKGIVLGLWSLYLVLCTLYLVFSRSSFCVITSKYKAQSTKYKGQRPKGPRPTTTSLETLLPTISYQSIQSGSFSH